MIWLPPRSTLTDTLCPYTTLCRSDVAQASGLSKRATQRFTHTLFALGYLRKNPITKEFSLAPRSLEVGLRYLQTSPLVNGSNPYLHSLNRACQETCRSEEHTSELQSLMRISYAVFCLKKKKKKKH